MQIHYELNSLKRKVMRLKQKKNEQSLPKDDHREIMRERILNNYRKKIELFEEIKIKGLTDDDLASIKNVEENKDKYHDFLIEVKEGLFYMKDFSYISIQNIQEIQDKIPPIPIVSKIHNVDITNSKPEKLYFNKMIYISFSTKINEEKSHWLMHVEVKEDQCWVIQSVSSLLGGFKKPHISHNISFQKELLKQILKKRIDLVMLNAGELAKLNLPIIRGLR
jgi:hypothetical protein